MDLRGAGRAVDARLVLLLILLSPAFGAVSPGCKTRRCLAQSLIDLSALSQPQDENCTQILYVPFIEYQTLSVDTQNLRFNSQLKAKMYWMDPDLAWNESEYNYNMVVLPVAKVWTPELIVTNAMSVEATHMAKDLLVHSSGMLEHTMSLSVVVDCQVNLLKYPFSYDECPVAIEAWSKEDCGMELRLDAVYMIDGNHGDWQTDNVLLQKRGDHRNFLMVQLSTKFMNPFISLILPSILIIIADVVSFALPLGGGERNSFKVTLVLSLVMFLLILNSLLPGDSQCSPIIRSHYCVVLVFLVLSMLASMVLTRVAKDGPLIPFVCAKKHTPPTSENHKDGDVEEETGDEESKAGADGRTEERDHLRAVVRFLQALEASDQDSQRCYSFARKLDKLCFFLYLFMVVSYFVVMVFMFTCYTCDVDHFTFWY